MTELEDVRVLADGLAFPEGPVALADGSVLVVEIRAGRLTRVAADGSPRDVLSDRDVLAATGLRPPQITELSLALPGRAGRPAALTVGELVDELRAAR